MALKTNKSAGVAPNATSYAGPVYVSGICSCLIVHNYCGDHHDDHTVGRNWRDHRDGHCHDRNGR